MRSFPVRIATTAVPVAVLAAGAGYLFAQVTGSYFADGRDDGRALADTLAWRLPFTLAAWSGGMVCVFELFRSMWSQKPNPTTAKRPGVDAEQLLLELLAQADAAEEQRKTAAAQPPGVSEQTPMPRFDPAPVPEIHFPAKSAGS